MSVIHTAPVLLPVGPALPGAPLHPSAAPLPDGGVLVEGDRIAAVGPLTELTAARPTARVRRWPGILTPGLVNAHAHLQYSDFADLAEAGLPFADWIQRLQARRRTYDDARWAESARRGLHAMLRTGTTAVADVVSDPAVLAPTARAGLAGVSYLEVVGADRAGWAGGRRDRLVAGLNAAPAGRRIGVSPHALYTLSTEVFAECVALARHRGLRIHSHLAETADESEYVLAGAGPLVETMRRFGLDFELAREGGGGRTPTAQLDLVGGLGVDAHVAHGVHCDAADRKLLRERGSVVALCVRSNQLLGAGQPPVAAYLTEEVPVALGTDSLASSPSLDLLAEAAAARALARTQGYGGADLDAVLFTAATRGGALAMGLTDSGVLAPGVRADLAVFDVEPGADPYTALLERGPGRCVATVLGGRLVHRAPC